MPYLHHLAIHFPIALGSLAAVLVLYGWVRRSTEWERTASLLAQLTALSAIIAVVTGLLSADHVIEGGGDREAVALHRNLALGATAVLVVAAVLARRGARATARSVSRLVGALAFFGAALVSLGAHFGGDLIHPGLAPWAAGPHSHGPMGDAERDHPHDGMPPVTPVAPAASPVDSDARANALGVGRSAPTAADAGAAARVGPAAAPARPAVAPHGAPGHSHAH